MRFSFSIDFLLKALHPAMNCGASLAVVFFAFFYIFFAFELEDRTLKFAKEVIKFAKTLQRTIANIEIIKQLVRASGSVGVSRFVEKKPKKATEKQRQLLIQEVTKLMKIFGAILEKTK